MPELMPDGTLAMIQHMKRWIDSFHIRGEAVEERKSSDSYSALVKTTRVNGAGGGGGAPGFFPVLVVWSAGSDGDATGYATWTYNIYANGDTAHATALTAAAVSPENSPARIVQGPVAKAVSDSIGQAYISADGTVHLYTCCEKHGTCT